MNDDELYRRVGEALSVRRNGLKLTQAEVAKRVGLSRASLANIETGRQKILLHNLYRLAAVLDVPRVEELLPAVKLKNPEPGEELKVGGEEINEKQRADVMAFVTQSGATRRSVAGSKK